MQKHGFLKGSLCGEGGFRLFGRYPAMWDRNTRRTGLLLALVLMALQGCVILPIPTPEHGLLSGRGEITKADVAPLEVGKTTREEVLLRFGEPEATLDDQQVFIYHWQIVRGYVFWALGIPACCQAGAAGAADVTPIAKDYLVLLEFDEHGQLKRFERTSIGFFESLTERVDTWTPSGSAKLTDIIETIGESKVQKAPRRFVINPVFSSPEQHAGALARLPSLRVKIAEFDDERAVGKDKVIGQRTALGIATHDIYLGRGPSDVVRDAVVAQWEAAGHRLVEDYPDVTVTGRLMEFKIETPSSFTTWSAVGTLDVIIEVRAKDEAAKPIVRRYHSRQVEKTVWILSEKHFESVILSCLQDLMHQMASDADLLRYVAGEQIDGSPNQTLQPTAKSGG